MNRVLDSLKEAVAQRELATNKAERTLAAVEAAIAAHDEAVAALDQAETTYELVLGHVVRGFGGSAYNEDCDRIRA